MVTTPPRVRRRSRPRPRSASTRSAWSRWAPRRRSSASTPRSRRRTSAARRRAVCSPARCGSVARVRRIGLLGGMSWESSAVYYRLLNETVRDRLGGLHSADCLLRSVDFADVEVLQRAGDWEAARALLQREAGALEAAGAELLVLCTNTMHKVAPEPGIPLVHIVDTTAHAVLAAGHRRVGLLATAYTMEQDFYVGRL